MHPIFEDDSEVDETRRMDGWNFKEIENQEFTFKVFDTIEHPWVHEECLHDDLDKSALMDKSDGESFYLPMVEVEFEGHQPCMHAMQIKEIMARWHAMVIFAIEPD